MIVWLASYPQAGITLLDSLLQYALVEQSYSIQDHSSGKPKSGHSAAFPQITNNSAHETTCTTEDYTFLKTYAYPTDNSKAIYIIRNGQSTLYSYYQYLLKTEKNKIALSDVISGKAPSGSWSEHVLQWQSRKTDDTLFLRYEYILASPLNQIKKIQAFLNIPITNTIRNTDPELKNNYAQPINLDAPFPLEPNLLPASHQSLFSFFHDEKSLLKTLRLNEKPLLKTLKLNERSLLEPTKPKPIHKKITKRLQHNPYLKALQDKFKSNSNSSLIPERWRTIPLQQPAATNHTLGIAVFGFSRPENIESILTSLAHQNSLQQVTVFIDGSQGNSNLEKKIRPVIEITKNFKHINIRSYNGNLGFRKMMLNAMQYMVQHHERILFLEDDCFPTRNCVSVIQNDLDIIEKRDDIFSVYGHHFEVDGEGCFGRFQGWGWATTSLKLSKIIPELQYWYLAEETEFTEFALQSMTDELLEFMEVTPERQPSNTLLSFYAWDEALCLLCAIRRLKHMKSSKRVVYNCGVCEESTHFTNSEVTRKPPFNMMTLAEAWTKF